jgi:hypothetical protein
MFLANTCANALGLDGSTQSSDVAGDEQSQINQTITRTELAGTRSAIVASAGAGPARRESPRPESDAARGGGEIEK